MTAIDTYAKYLIRNSQIWGDQPAIRRKKFGIWQTYTWKDLYREAKLAGLGLLALGFKPEDKVAVIGDDEPEGLWAECGAQAIGGIVVALWSDSIAKEVAYIINHSEARFVFAEDQEQVDKLLEIQEQTPTVQKVIYWDPKGLRKYDDPILMSYDQLTKLGMEYDRSNPGIFEKKATARKDNDTAIICYTSGTTGSLPKGAVITHRSILKSAQTMQEFIEVDVGEDVFSTFAAASIFHHWFIGLSFMKGAIINMPEEPETIMHDYREISPRFMLLGPRQWQSLVSTTQIKVNDGGFLKKFTYDLFLKIGYRVMDLHHAGGHIPFYWKMLYKMGDLLVYRPLRDKLGLVKTKYPATGSAFLSPDFFKFYQAIGLNLIQCYGSTEAGFVSCHPQDDINIDSVGCIGSKVKARLSEDQEIMISGDGIFSCYFKDPEKTEEALKNGWFHTGDAGHIDKKSHIYYQDRVKNLEQLSNGFKYAPAYIEGKLQFSPYIMDAMVIGGKNRNYISAIIAMDFASIAKWAEREHISYTTFVGLSQRDEVAELIKEDIEKVNKTLPQETRIKKFVLLHKEFDPDDAELTRTRKLRRSYLQETYRDLIEAIYEGKTEMPVVADVRYRDGRTGQIKTDIKIRSVE